MAGEQHRVRQGERLRFDWSVAHAHELTVRAERNQTGPKELPVEQQLLSSSATVMGDHP